MTSTVLVMAQDIGQERRKPGPTAWTVLNDAGLLRALMAERRLSVRRLARTVGCHHSMIDALRNGRAHSCTPKLARNIEDALGVAPGRLFHVRVAQQEQP